MMLFLVRHANPQIDPAVAASQWRLSAGGLERAGELAKHLRGRGIQAVVSSAEPKAYQTAQILAEMVGLQVEVADGLHEHERPLTPGSFTSRDEFQAQVEAFFDQPGQLVFGRETAEQCLHRFNQAIHEVIARHPSKIQAVVSHGTVLSLFLSHCNHLDAFTFWQALGMPACIQVNIPGFNIVENWTMPEPEPAEDEKTK
jgi:broad specificity phosphatase PhoE